jgi:heme/copper-type cytochrome/quinol oxidase subunit 2
MDGQMAGEKQKEEEEEAHQIFMVMVVMGLRIHLGVMIF